MLKASPFCDDRAVTPTIAPAVFPDDVFAVRALFREYAESLGFSLDYQDFEAELASLPGAFAPPTGALLLAREGDEPAGTVALRPLEADICEMKRLYVRPQFQRMALGRGLATAIIAEARRLGYRKMRLDTVASMRPAITLYTSLGFVVIEPYYATPLAGTVFFELVL